MRKGGIERTEGMATGFSNGHGYLQLVLARGFVVVSELLVDVSVETEVEAVCQAAKYVFHLLCVRVTAERFSEIIDVDESVLHRER